MLEAVIISAGVLYVVGLLLLFVVSFVSENTEASVFLLIALVFSVLLYFAYNFIDDHSGGVILTLKIISFIVIILCSLFMLTRIAFISLFFYIGVILFFFYYLDIYSYVNDSVWIALLSFFVFLIFSIIFCVIVEGVYVDDEVSYSASRKMDNDILLARNSLNKAKEISSSLDKIDKG